MSVFWLNHWSLFPMVKLIYELLPDAEQTTHYGDVIMSTMTSHITSVSIVYSAVCSDPDQRKHQSSASLAFARGIHRWPVNSPHKGPVTRKMFPLDDVMMKPLPEQMKTYSSLRHTCITRQNANLLRSSDAMRGWLPWSSFVQVMACRLLGARPLHEPIMTFCWLDPLEQISTKFESKHNNLHTKKK